MISQEIHLFGHINDVHLGAFVTQIYTKNIRSTSVV